MKIKNKFKTLINEKNPYKQVINILKYLDKHNNHNNYKNKEKINNQIEKIVNDEELNKEEFSFNIRNYPIKTFTDINQSIKLQEILPEETSDMYYFLNPLPGGNIYLPRFKIYSPFYYSTKPEYDKGDIPCWSLSALFTTLPNKIYDYHKILYYYNNVYHCNYIDDDGAPLEKDIITTSNDPIDACFEMLLKLYETKTHK